MTVIGKLVQIGGALEAFDREKKKYSGDVSVITGFTAAYALYVHEAVGMKLKGKPRSKPSKGKYWDPQGRGQAKYLESAARDLKDEVGLTITKAVRKKVPLASALAVGALRIQREAQRRVPVDTGNLKASAFTRKEQL